MFKGASTLADKFPKVILPTGLWKFTEKWENKAGIKCFATKLEPTTLQSVVEYLDLHTQPPGSLYEIILNIIK
jgi:hypothetical protein